MEQVLISNDFNFKKGAMELTFLINQFTASTYNDNDCPPFFIIDEETLKFRWNDYKIRSNWGNPM